MATTTNRTRITLLPRPVLTKSQRETVRVLCATCHYRDQKRNYVRWEGSDETEYGYREWICDGRHFNHQWRDKTALCFADNYYVGKDGIPVEIK